MMSIGQIDVLKSYHISHIYISIIRPVHSISLYKRNNQCERNTKQQESEKERDWRKERKGETGNKQTEGGLRDEKEVTERCGGVHLLCKAPFLLQEH